MNGEDAQVGREEAQAGLPTVMVSSFRMAMTGTVTIKVACPVAQTQTRTGAINDDGTHLGSYYSPVPRNYTENLLGNEQTMRVLEPPYM
jgi:hypothetical protein